MSINAGPPAIDDGIEFVLDAGNRKSFPRSGTSWTNLKEGLGNHTINNSPVFSSSNGGYFSFDGTDDSVSIGSVESILSNVSQFSIAFWFYTNDITSRTGIFGRDSGGLAQLSVINNSGGMECRPINHRQKFGSLTLSGNITVGKWHNVVWVYDGSLSGNSEILKCYVDNVQKSLSFGSQALPTSTGDVTATNYTLADVTGNHLDGGISAFKIYEQSLTPSEIRRNYLAARGRYK